MWIEHPLVLSIVAFPIAAMAGFACLLRSGLPLTRRAIASSTINSGLFGCAIVMAGYHTWGLTHIWLIMAFAVMAGLGGNALVEVGVQMLKMYAKKLGNGNESVGKINGTGRGRRDVK